jgi:hypothetical protein
MIQAYKFSLYDQLYHGCQVLWRVKTGCAFNKLNQYLGYVSNPSNLSLESDLKKCACVDLIAKSFEPNIC